MSMSEFEGQLNNDGDAISSLHKQEHALPADFGEEDLAFVEELNALFSPEEEELPPYFAQTLLESEDPRFYPVEPGFEKKTSVRVFRDLKLRRPLYHNPRSLLGAVTTGMRGISARRSLLAFTAAFMFMILITVAFTAPSFAQGMAILLQGARGGVYQVPNYPESVPSGPYTLISIIAMLNPGRSAFLRRYNNCISACTGLRGILVTILWTLFTSIKQRISRGLMDQLWNWCLASLKPGHHQRGPARLSYVNLNRVKRSFKWCKMRQCISYKTISTVSHRLSM